MDYEKWSDVLEKRFFFRMALVVGWGIVLMLYIAGINIWFAALSVFTISFLLWAEDTNFFIKEMYIEDRINYILLWFGILIMLVGLLSAA